jgi:8-oxo-dGTP pyrophosphatase MutT (NUDIX family)
MPSTVFVVLRRDGAFVALRRVNTGVMDGHFSVPAGAVEAGETLLEAAVREAREEVGVSLEPGSLRLAHTMHCRTLGEAWLGHVFVADDWAGEPALMEPDRHADLRMASPAVMPEPFVPYVRAALEGIERGEAFSAWGFEG